MITTSQAYKDLMRSPVVESMMLITVSDGENSVVLGDRDIVSESLKINWRSSNNKTLSLGTCYAASLNFSATSFFETEVEGNYLTITPVIYYNLGGGLEEEIPLGVFRCDNPVNHGRTTSYECYDFMLSLDKKVPSRFSGKPFNVLTYICGECGVELGNTSQQIAAMANGSQTVVIDPTRVANYRDGISYISIVLGGYAQFGRDGRLYIRQFHKVPDMTLMRKRRTASAFAGYRTQFVGVECRFLAEQNFYPYSYKNESMDVGVVMDLGDIPIIEGNEQTKHLVLERIYDGALAGLQYYPCEIGYMSDASIEAGDMIATPDKEGYSRNILLTSVTFAWRKEGALVSEGANPQMGVVTTQAKKTAQAIANSTNQNTIVTATYVNVGQIVVDDSEQVDVTDLKFTTNKDLTAIFGAEVPVYSDGEGYVTMTYESNGIPGDEVTARVSAGYNLITLVNHLYYEAGSVVFLKVKAQTSAIGSGSAPEVVIEQDKIRSYIFAQGIEVEAPWDGIIAIAEHIGFVESVMALYGITDGVSVEVKYPTGATLAEVVGAIVGGSQTVGISDTMALSLVYGDWVLRMGMGHRAGMGRMFAPYQVT